MTLTIAIFLLLGGSSPVQASDLNTLIDGVDRTFGRMKDLSTDFAQIYANGLNQKQQETGHLYLMKPGRMRWEYQKEGKLFVSDGKTVYYYIPSANQVSRERVKDTTDDRIPLMFLLGREGLRNEFSQFSMLAAKPLLQGDKVIRLVPKRKSDLKSIEMEVDPATYLIHRLVLITIDGTPEGARSEFIFSNMRVNTGLKSTLFDFKLPAGTTVLEGVAP